MKITVFTSNQPRHVALINRIASISDKTYAVLECNTVFPGGGQDYLRSSEVMERYFENVMRAEKSLYGDLSFLKSNVRVLSIKSGDLSLLKREQLQEALTADLYIVFGSSYIKGWLIDHLVESRAINIHIGLSPYYRGSSCNFWALYDYRPEYIGSTIHLLSKGLDTGPILYHSVPRLNDESPFDFTMKSVEAAQQSLLERISSKLIFEMTPQIQDKTKEIRYSKNSDFTDFVAEEFLKRKLTGSDIANLISNAVKPTLFEPFCF